MSLYQIFLIIILGFFLVKSFGTFKKTKKPKDAILIIIWFLFLIFAVFPKFSYFISRISGMGENLNTLIFTGFVILFALVFIMMQSIEKLKRDITELVKKDALRDFEKLKK